MNAVFLALLEQLNSSVFILVAVLFLMFWIVYKIGCWATTFTHFEERVKGVEGLSDKVTRISTMVEMIYRHIHPNAPTKEASPISLTPVGEDISQRINASAILEKYVDRLVAEVEKSHPKNAYDVQLASFTVARTQLLTMLTEEELIAAKREAYERGLLIEDILSVIGVLLRNHVLALKNMPISDVDTHDPARKYT